MRIGIAIATTQPGNAAGAVATGVPVEITPPSISGIATVGQTLTGNHGTYTNYPSSFTQRWLNAGVAIGGATGATYVVQAGDVGDNITFEETPSNVGFGAGSASTSTAVVPVAAPAITGTPDTTGTESTAYSFTPGKLGGRGTGVWTLSGTIGASGLSFNTSTGALTAASLGAAATYGPYSIYWTDDDGIQSNTIGPWSVVVSASGGGVPVNSVAPAITGMNSSGTADPGQVLTVSTGTWSNSPSSYSYQWKLAGANVGTNANTYTPTDVGPAALAVTCEVTATNGSGSSTPATSNSVNTFHPLQIANITSMWDAEDASSIFETGGLVEEFTSVTPDAIVLAQLTGSYQPIYAATSYNGRPGVTFDSVDDYLRASGTFTPTGATPEEMWALASMDFATGSGTDRYLFGQGNANVNGSTSRQIARRVLTSQSRARAQVNGSVAEGPTTVAWVGPHVARVEIGATSTTISLDNQAGVTATITPITTGTSITMGASQNGTPGAFWNGTVSAVMRFSSLTADEVQSLYRWAGQRSGLTLP